MPAPDRLTVLFVPLERRTDGTVHRGSNAIEMLRRRFHVVGLERERGFGGGLILGALRMLLYWGRVAAFALRHRRSIDLLFCENSHALLGGLLGRAIGRPCIWNMEGEDALYLDVWGRSALVRWLVLGSDALAARFCQRLLVPCEEDRRAYIRRGYGSDGSVVTVPLAVDLDRLPLGLEDREGLRRRLGLPPDRTILIYTGQRTQAPYREGAEWICRELAPRLGPLLDRTLILLTGRGEVVPTPYPQVVFIGFVPNVLEYVAAADIGLVPLWREAGVPGKMIEYMALGKPVVISSRFRGLQHLEDGANAMLAADPEEFVQRVAYLIQHPQEARRMGDRAREAARRHYSHQAVAPQLWRVVEEMAGRRGRA